MCDITAYIRSPLHVKGWRDEKKEINLLELYEWRAHTDPKSKTPLNLTKHAMQNDINNKKNNAEELFCKTNT